MKAATSGLKSAGNLFGSAGGSTGPRPNWKFDISVPEQAASQPATSTIAIAGPARRIVNPDNSSTPASSRPQGPADARALSGPSKAADLSPAPTAARFPSCPAVL